MAEKRQKVGKKQRTEVEDTKTVRDWSQHIQSTHGDPHPVNVVSRLPPNNMFVADIQGSSDLREIWKMFSGAQKVEFVSKYGNIAKLLDITINVDALRAALEFWDPTYRCFSFNIIEMTPTIEEYEELLKIPVETEGKIYYYDKTQTGKRTLTRIVGSMPGLNIENIIDKKGNNEGVPINIFVQLMKQNMNDSKVLTLFALCLYGVVFFPSIRGHIDIKVIKFFQQIQHGYNPVLSILAETIRSLDYCRIEGKGRFIGCASLLHVWLMSHLKYPSLDLHMPKMNFSVSWMTNADPITECARIRQSSDLPKRNAWIAFLSQLKAKNVEWTALWMPMRPMIYRCGQSHTVPLLGPLGGTSYAPLLVLRQMSTEQFIPAVDGLRDLDFEYGDEGSEDKIKRALESWKVIRKIKNEDSHDTTTRGYKTWFANKKKLENPSKGKEKVLESEQTCKIGEIRFEPVSRENEKTIEPEKIFEMGETSVAELQKKMILLEARALEAEGDLFEAHKLLKSQGQRLKSQMKLERDNQELDRENRRLAKAAGKWKEKSVYLQRKMEAKDEYIADLESNVDALQQVISELNAAVEAKRAQVVETEEHNDSLRQAFENLQYRLNKCQSSAEKILQAHEHVKEQYKDLYGETEHLRHQKEVHLAYINNAMQNLRMLCKRASVFADWGADLRGGLHFLQPNGEELMEFLSILCRELRYVGRFM